MADPIISVSGLRGIIGSTLTPEVALRYATAFSALAPPGPFVITRDSRPSGRLLADVIHATLNAAGRDTLDAGVAATPTTGVLVRRLYGRRGYPNLGQSQSARVQRAETPLGRGTRDSRRGGPVGPPTLSPRHGGLGGTHRTGCSAVVLRSALGSSGRRPGHGGRTADQSRRIQGAAGLQPRGRRPPGTPPAGNPGLPGDDPGRAARRSVRPPRRADGREPGQRAGGRDCGREPTSDSARTRTPIAWPPSMRPAATWARSTRWRCA